MTTSGATGECGTTSGHVFSVLGLFETDYRLDADDVAEFWAAWEEEESGGGEKAPLVLHLINKNGNKGVWFRHYGESGGWRGNDFRAGGRTEFSMGGANGTLKWMWYTGSETSFEPIGEVDVLNNQTVTFGAHGDAVEVSSVGGADDPDNKLGYHYNKHVGAAGLWLDGPDNVGKPLRLVKLRNPWGRGEWKGMWSDNHVTWRAFPAVKTELEQTDRNDGVFYMQWADFQAHFGYVMMSRPVEVVENQNVNDSKKPMVLHLKNRNAARGVWWRLYYPGSAGAGWHGNDIGPGSGSGQIAMRRAAGVLKWRWWNSGEAEIWDEDLVREADVRHDQVVSFPAAEEEEAVVE